MEILKVVAQEKNNWRLGPPFRVSKKGISVIVPILHDIIGDRTYQLLREAKKQVEITDTGSIFELIAHNKGNIPIFIRAGELVEGKTQTRMVVESVIVYPNEKKIINTRCSYRSKGIRAGELLKSTDNVAPSKIMTSVISKADKVEQNFIWDQAEKYSQETTNSIVRELLDCHVMEIDSSPNRTISRFQKIITSKSEDDLAGNIDEVNKLLKNIIKKIPTTPTQVGIALLRNTDCELIEFFDLPEPWQESRDSILTSEAQLITKSEKNGFVKFQQEIALKSVKDILKSKFKESVLASNGYRVIQLSNDNYVGQVVELNKKVIHALILKSTIEEL